MSCWRSQPRFQAQVLIKVAPFKDLQDTVSRRLVKASVFIWVGLKDWSFQLDSCLGVRESSRFQGGARRVMG